MSLKQFSQPLQQNVARALWCPLGPSCAVPAAAALWGWGWVAGAWGAREDTTGSGPKPGSWQTHASSSPNAMSLRMHGKNPALVRISQGEGVPPKYNFGVRGTAGACLYREWTINCDLPFDCTNTLVPVWIDLCISVLNYLLDTLNFRLDSLPFVFKCK